jgi:predicted Holliday junction resolvase-like endonuclease
MTISNPLLLAVLILFLVALVFFLPLYLLVALWRITIYRRQVELLKSQRVERSKQEEDIRRKVQEVTDRLRDLGSRTEQIQERWGKLIDRLEGLASRFDKP